MDEMIKLLPKVAGVRTSFRSYPDQGSFEDFFRSYSQTKNRLCFMGISITSYNVCHVYVKEMEGRITAHRGHFCRVPAGLGFGPALVPETWTVNAGTSPLPSNDGIVFGGSDCMGTVVGLGGGLEDRLKTPKSPPRY